MEPAAPEKESLNVVVQPDGGPGTVVAELLAAKVRLVSVAASKAKAAAAAAMAARRAGIARGSQRGVGCIRFSSLSRRAAMPAWGRPVRPWTAGQRTAGGGQPQLARIWHWVGRISVRGARSRSSIRDRSRCAARCPSSRSGWPTVVSAGVTTRLA